MTQSSQLVNDYRSVEDLLNQELRRLAWEACLYLRDQNFGGFAQRQQDMIQISDKIDSQLTADLKDLFYEIGFNLYDYDNNEDAKYDTDFNKICTDFEKRSLSICRKYMN